MRVLSILKERNLINIEIRQMTGMERLQVVRFMKELEEHGVKMENKERILYYFLDKS